jgi:hypothetical protein
MQVQKSQILCINGAFAPFTVHKSFVSILLASHCAFQCGSRTPSGKLLLRISRHPTCMAAPEPDPKQQGDGKSRTMVLVLLGIVIASIAAFMVLRPSPSGAGHPTSTSSHAPPSQ